MLGGIPFLWNRGIASCTNVGWLAGQITSAVGNTMVGCGAGFSNTLGYCNTFTGYQTGSSNVTGYYNTFVGQSAGNMNDGYENAFFGGLAGFSNTTGHNNVFVGHSSGFNTNGNFISMLGENTGFNDLSGRLNTYIGANADADPSTPALTNSTALGANAIVATDNTVIIGGGNSTNHCMVGIGSSDFVYGPGAKLDVQNDATNWTNPIIPVVNNTGTSNYAGIFETFGSNSILAVSYWGIRAQSSVRSSPWNNIGGDFRAWNCDINNIGVLGVSDGNTGINNMGGKFYAGNNPTNFGVYGEAGITTGSSPSNVDIAIYGNCKSTALVGPGFPPPFVSPGSTWAGYFDGDVYINGFGIGSTSGLFTASDAMFKTSIDSIPNTLTIIKQLKPRQFFLDTMNAYGLNFSNRKQYGFIAQDVEAVLPELVSNTTKPANADSLGNIVTPSVTYKSLNYNAFFALLMRGMQEQQRTIDSLTTNNTKQDSINNYVQHQIAQLTHIINDCCERHGDDDDDNGHHDDGHHSPSHTTITLTDAQNIVLEQNVPNPFAEQTTINYSLPDNTGKAQILFYNASGKLIQSVELTARGSASLNVFAQDLSNGSYTYTLIADGKIIDTKKMVKQ